MPHRSDIRCCARAWAIEERASSRSANRSADLTRYVSIERSFLSLEPHTAIKPAKTARFVIGHRQTIQRA